MMRFAYADPPYFGQGLKSYGTLHSEAYLWDEKESHWKLQEDLIEHFPDGWVMSCNPKDLSWIVRYPEITRICAWVKTFAQIRQTTVQYFWEPVLLVGGRIENGRKPMVLDWLNCAANQKRGLKGSKPDKFNDWLLDLLNVQEGDEVVDVFPGTNSLKDALDKRGAIWKLKN